MFRPLQLAATPTGPTGNSVVGVFTGGGFPVMNFAKSAGSITSGAGVVWQALINDDGYPTGATIPSNITGNFPLPSQLYSRMRLQFDNGGGFQISGPSFIVYNTYIGGAATSGVVSGVAGTSGQVNFNLGIISKTNPAVDFNFGSLITAVGTNTGLVQFTLPASAMQNGGVAGNAAAGTALLNSSLVWSSGSGGMVTATTVEPHGLPSGLLLQMTIVGAAPSGYNVGAVTATVTGANTFTYPLAVDPGSATVQGFWTAITLTAQFNHISAGLPNGATGPNSDGSWTLYKINNNTVVVAGSSTYAGSTTIVGSGGAGVQSELVMSVAQVTWLFPSSSSYSGIANVILCEKTDIDGSNAFGLQVTNPATGYPYQARADRVAQLQQINPGFLRTLDMSAVAGSLATDFNYRPRLTNFSYFASPGTKFFADYWVGNIVNGGSDIYAASSPAASPSGAIPDGLVIQGFIPAGSANTGRNPVIDLDGRGTYPVYSGGNTGAGAFMQEYLITGTPTVGDVYTITSPAGGVLSYTVLAGDTTAAILAASIAAKIAAAGPFLTEGIITQSGNTLAARSLYFFANNGSGRTFSCGVTGAGTATITMGPIPVGIIAASRVVSFTFNKLLGGWWMGPISTSALAGGGLNYGAPVEVMCELANRARSGLYINIPMFYSNQSVYDMTALCRDTLTSDLSLAEELSNEDWNTGQNQTGQSFVMGCCLGWVFSSNVGMHSFYSLRFRQFMEQAINAWTTTRSRASFVAAMQMMEAGNSLPGTETIKYRLESFNLTTTNPTYAALGGPGATAGITYTAVGDRSVDWADTNGAAEYFCGAAFGQSSSNWSGSISNFTAALQASADWASGNPTLMAAAKAALYNDFYDGSLCTGNARGAILSAFQTRTTTWYNNAFAPYDSVRAAFIPPKAPLGRMDYEAGPITCFGNVPQGYTRDPTNLAAQFATNGWNTSAYGASNLIVARNLIDLYFNGFETETGSNGMGAIWTALYEMLVSTNPGRTVRPSSYQWDGPSAFSIMGNSFASAIWAAFYAIAAWNASSH